VGCIVLNPVQEGLVSLQIKETSVSSLGWEEKKSKVVVGELVCCLKRDYANVKEYAQKILF